MPETTSHETVEEIRRQATLRANLHKAIAQASDEMAPVGDEYSGPLTPRLLAERMVAAPKLEKTQVRQLEALAYTTNKISDIIDWLKRQIGRDGKNRNWGYERIGADVIAALEGQGKRAKTIAADVNPGDSALPRQVHLRLCREYVKHLTAEFIYRKKGEG